MQVGRGPDQPTSSAKALHFSPNFRSLFAYYVKHIDVFFSQKCFIKISFNIFFSFPFLFSHFVYVSKSKPGLFEQTSKVAFSKYSFYSSLFIFFHFLYGSKSKPGLFGQTSKVALWPGVRLLLLRWNFAIVLVEIITHNPRYVKGDSFYSIRT